MQSDIPTFLCSWTVKPLRVAAIIAPSSNAWTDLITRGIVPRIGPAIELGPGTGVFTDKLPAWGVAEVGLTLVEYGSNFARLLQMRFPQARVMWMDATRLKSVAFVPSSRSAPWSVDRY